MDKLSSTAWQRKALEHRQGLMGLLSQVGFNNYQSQEFIQHMKGLIALEVQREEASFFEENY